MKIDYNAIKSYFEKNDSPLHFRFDYNARYRVTNGEDEQPSLSLEDFLSLMTLCRPNLGTKVIDTFTQKNASLTIGIIGNAVGNDSMLVDNIKSRVKVGELEPAINGWNFEDYAAFDKYQQTQLIAQSKNKISSLFGINPRIFIPPYGKSNNDTYYAMETNGIYILSGIPNIVSDNVGKIHIFSTLAFDGESSGEGKNAQGNLLSDIHNSMEINGHAVVMINFQDFAKSNGTAKINEPNMTKIQYPPIPH